MKNKNKIVILITALIIITIRFCDKNYVFNEKYKNVESIKMNASIIEISDITEDKISYLVKYDKNKFLLNVYNDKNSAQKEDVDNNLYELKYGDIIEFTGTMSKNNKLGNPYEFDYKKYLNSKNIVSTISTYNIKLIGKENSNLVYKFAYSLRDFIEYRIDELLPNRESNLFKSIMYGDDLNLDENIKELFDKNGILHIISVSGSHMILIVSFISILKKYINKYIFFGLNFLLIYIFCIICSMELSVLRAGIMALIPLCFSIYKKQDFKISIYSNILLSFLILFIYNPYSIFNTGMLMSYAAVISIKMFYTQIYSLLNIKLLKLLKINYIKKKTFKSHIYYIFNIINKGISLNLAVQILLIPMEIQNFNRFELASFISNLLIVPIVSFQNFLGFLTLFFIHIPFISDILINSNYILLKLIVFLSELLFKIKIPTLYIPDLNIFIIFFYYAVIIINNYKKYIIVRLSKTKKEILRYSIIFSNILISILIIFNYIYVIYIENYIYFFYVEQGNMAMIRESGKTIIMDIGSKKEKLAANVLNNFLQAKAIKNIDLIILSHMHEDHVNGLYDLNDKLIVDNIAFGMQKNKEEEEYLKVIDFIYKRKINKLELEKYDNINFKNIRIDILSPNSNKNIDKTDELNSNSVVSVVSTNKKRMLFMGDATKKSEESIINDLNNIDSVEKKDYYFKLLSNIDILQVGHHGSKTSTSGMFLNNIKVKNGIISAKKKVYGHPSKETIDILNEYNINILNLENSGAIRF